MISWFVGLETTAKLYVPEDPDAVLLSDILVVVKGVVVDFMKAFGPDTVWFIAEDERFTLSVLI